MDRAMVERHLAIVEEHLGTGEKNIERQHEILEELRRNGYATDQAEKLLVNFLDIQKTRIATREHILGELASLK